MAGHRVLVIGVGSIGERHLRCFQKTGRADLSFCEVNAELRQNIAGKYQVNQAFAALDAALAQPPEIAVICTPAHLHIPMATQLAQRGVHLLIEKPLSTSEAGIAELAQIIAAKKLTAAVAYVLRTYPALQAMKKAISEKRFGEPVQVVVVGGQHFPTYRPAYRQIYYRDRATGGGAIQDAITHLVNSAQWLVGPVDRLLCDAAHQVLDGVTVEDTVHLITRHGSVMGSFCLNQYQAPNETSITVVCTKGTVRWEAHQQRWMWMTEPGGKWQEQVLGSTDRDQSFIDQASAFLDSVEGKAPVLCTLEEGLQTLRTNLAALRGSDQPGWVQVQPAAKKA